jgi:hypothetical protein
MKEENNKEKKLFFPFKGFTIKPYEKPSPVLEFEPGKRNPEYRRRVIRHSK